MKHLKELFTDSGQACRRMNEWGKEQKPFFFLTDFECKHCLVEDVTNLPTDELQFEFPEISHKAVRPQTSIAWEILPESFESYRQSFDIVRRNLLAGNSFLTNLTCSTPVKTNLSLLQIFEHAKARYKLWLKDRFVVVSPETFVRIHDGFIYSYPMKGTIDANLPHADKQLLNDPKETAEHATITDLIRNDMSRFASEVTVLRYRYLDKLHTHKGTLWQMSSEIRGRLPITTAHNWATCSSVCYPQAPSPEHPRKKQSRLSTRRNTTGADFIPVSWATSTGATSTVP